jgi:hypothetical protein
MSNELTKHPRAVRPGGRSEISIGVQKRWPGISYECRHNDHQECIKKRCPCPCGHGALDTRSSVRVTS